MYTRLIVTLGLLASTVESVAATPKRFSIPARRASTTLQQRDGTHAEADATEHVVVDFTFGGQRIPVALDSGSTFTWVASTLDTNKGETDSLPALFNPNTSTTYHDENDPSDAYNCGGTSTVCFMGVDDVATAGLTANGMAFGVATHISSGTFSSGQAATMGFGRQANDPSGWLPRDQTFWLRAGADLEMPYLFTVDLYQDRNGTFDFGYIDTEKYTGDITFAPMDTTQTNWNFNMNGFAIGNGAKQSVDTFAGVIDTGGPNIGLPSFVVNPYFDSIGGSPSPGNSHDYPCSAYPPPDLTLYLENGGTLVLNGTFLVQPPDGSSDTCNGRLDDSQQTAYNIGASVLDQKFVVFDHANARVGFADKRQAGQPAGVAPRSMSASSSSSTGTAATSASTGSAGTTTGSATSRATSSAGTATPTSGGSQIVTRLMSLYTLLVFVVYHVL
jgi:aspergillopepsin I